MVGRALWQTKKKARRLFALISILCALCYSNVSYLGATIKYTRSGDAVAQHQSSPNRTTLTPILRQLLAEKSIESAVASSFADRPFLVVCDNVDNSLTPIFSNFTVVRLNKNEQPPPWNATVFLHGERCTDQPYVKEAMERRKSSPFLVAPNQTSASWIQGVRWPNSTKKYLRAIRERPAIIKTYGEVFWRIHYKDQSCGNVDFVVYREVETPIPDCLQIHFLQGVSTTMTRGIEGEFGMRNTAGIFKKAVAHPHKHNSVKYEKFCSFLVRYNSTRPAYMFNNTKYDTDAFVRHMFFLQLSEYKPCERIMECPGSPFEAFRCMVGYKFHVTMENTLVDGYVTEKLFK